MPPSFHTRSHQRNVWLETQRGCCIKVSQTHVRESSVLHSIKNCRRSVLRNSHSFKIHTASLNKVTLNKLRGLITAFSTRPFLLAHCMLLSPTWGIFQGLLAVVFPEPFGVCGWRVKPFISEVLRIYQI